MQAVALKMNDNNEARFPKIDWALRYAYMAEATRGRSGSMGDHSDNMEGLDEFQLFMAKLRSGMPRQDMIADGMMIKNTVQRYLDKKMGITGRCTVGARYRIPNDPVLRDLKDMDYRLLAGKLAAHNKKLARLQWFTIDMIRGYMGERVHHDLVAWAHLLEINEKTLYRYAGSQDPAHRSVRYTLWLWESEAVSHAEKKLADEGMML